MYYEEYYNMTKEELGVELIGLIEERASMLRDVESHTIAINELIQISSALSIIEQIENEKKQLESLDESFTKFFKNCKLTNP